MHWYDLLGGIASGGTVGGGFWLVARTWIGHKLKQIATDATEAAVKDVKTDLQDLRERFAAETGGNSNGLRQALNAVANDIAHVKGFLEGQQVKQ